MRRALIASAMSWMALLGLGLAFPTLAIAAEPYPALTSCYGELMDIGVADPCVGSIQVALNKLGIPNPPLLVDSIYGDSTKAAIIEFQHRSNLAPDGVAGRQTITELSRSANQPSPSTTTASGVADCPGGGQPFISGGSEIVELSAGDNHPNFSDKTDDIEIGHSQGQSGTWTTSSSISGNVEVGEDPIKFGLTASTDSSSSVTLTMTSSEAHKFTVPAHTTMRVDYMAVLGTTHQGDKCAVDRTEVKVLGTGYRITTVDQDTGEEQQRYSWPTMTNVSVPTF